MSGIVPSDFKKVTYDVSTSGTSAILTAKLPAGFTMREYTRIFDLRHAKELGMSEQEYIYNQQEEMRKDLMARMILINKGRLLN